VPGAYGLLTEARYARLTLLAYRAALLCFQNGPQPFLRLRSTLAPESR